MWVYLAISILTSSYDIRIPCPRGLDNCSIWHIESVVDTVKIDTSFFCEKKEAVFRIKWFNRSRWTHDNETTFVTRMKLDSIRGGVYQR